MRCKRKLLFWQLRGRCEALRRWGHHGVGPAPSRGPFSWGLDCGPSRRMLGSAVWLIADVSVDTDVAEVGGHRLALRSVWSSRRPKCLCPEGNSGRKGPESNKGCTRSLFPGRPPAPSPLHPIIGRRAGGLPGQQCLTASEGLDSGLGETSFILQQVK